MDVYLICDESGAKGYSDVSEAYPGETGVFAGYLVKRHGCQAYTVDSLCLSIQMSNNLFQRIAKIRIR